MSASHIGICSPSMSTRPSSRPTYRCGNCGLLLDSWAAAERHADEVHVGTGTRFELVLLDPEATP